MDIVSIFKLTVCKSFNKLRLLSDHDLVQIIHDFRPWDFLNRGNLSLVIVKHLSEWVCRHSTWLGLILFKLSWDYMIYRLSLDYITRLRDSSGYSWDRSILLRHRRLDYWLFFLRSFLINELPHLCTRYLAFILHSLWIYYLQSLKK